MTAIAAQRRAIGFVHRVSITPCVSFTNMSASPRESLSETAASTCVPTTTTLDAETARRRGASRRAPLGAKPTIRLVAERAEVGISTVSRVLNGGHVSPIVRRRVQCIIEELGYSPSVTAQALVLGRAGSIGLAVASSQSLWFSQVLSGIEEALTPTRKSVLIASTMLQGHYAPEPVLAWIADGRVDGLILVRYSRRDRPMIEAATQAGLPIVLIAPDVTPPDGFIIRCDNLKAGRLAAKHLAELGHRRIAFAGGPEESLDTRQRLEGLQEGLAELGTTTAGDDIWFGPSYARAAGIEYGDLFLARLPHERPSAVVLANDPMALGFMRTVLQHGVRVPEQVSVVGFDGTPDGEQFWPGLTTVLQPTQRMAMSACQALIDSIERRKPANGTSLAEFVGEILVRESTAAPPRAELRLQSRSDALELSPRADTAGIGAQ